MRRDRAVVGSLHGPIPKISPEGNKVSQVVVGARDVLENSPFPWSFTIGVVKVIERLEVSASVSIIVYIRQH